MDDAALRARRLASQRAFYRMFVPHSPGGQLLELDGVTASIVPAAPERSVFNAVVYDDADALLGVLDEIAAAYDEAGIQAWTVWVPAGERKVAKALAAAGHLLDANPEAMARSLDGVERPDLRDWTADADIRDVAAVNDASYPFGSDPFTRAFSSLPPGSAHLYAARVDGRTAAVLITHDHDGDCGVWAVATLPEARGGGLSRALLAHALVDARERGCETTSLEATQLGRPVYERVGYRPLGVVEMWERRKSGPRDRA